MYKFWEVYLALNPSHILQNQLYLSYQWDLNAHQLKIHVPISQIGRGVQLNPELKLTPHVMMTSSPA